MKKILLLLIAFIFINTSHAQETAPTLSLGLDQVLFKKGTLDVDLIATMIAEKQDELKKRIVEKEILGPALESSSFATRNYVFSAVKCLMNEKDKNVIKKTLMEQTVNYTIVYVFAEMYVQLSWHELAKKQSDKDSYFTRLGITSDTLTFNNTTIQNVQKNFLNISKLFQLDSAFVELTPINLKDQPYKFRDILIDMVFNAVLDDPILRSKGFFTNALYFDLDYYKQASNYHRLPKHPLKDSMYKDIKWFVSDVAQWYESFEELAEIIEKKGKTPNQDVKQALRKNITAKTQNSADILEAYKHELAKDQIDSIKLHLEKANNDNERFKLLEGKIKDTRDKELQKLKDKLKWDTISIDRQRSLVLILTNYSLGQNTVDSVLTMLGTKSLDNQITEQIRLIDALNGNINSARESIKLAKEGTENLHALLDNIITDIVNKKELDYDILVAHLEREILNISNSNSDINIFNDSMIRNLYKHFYFVKFNRDQIGNLAYLRWSQSELLPDLAFLNLKSGGKLKNVIQLTQALNSLIEVDIFEPILEHIDSNKLSKQLSYLLDETEGFHVNYLKFFQRLDDLGKMETYYYLLNEVLLAYESCSNENVAAALKLILGSIVKYTDFDQTNDKLEIDVETIILTLAQKYGDRDKNPFNFYMTVGLNNAFALRENTLFNAEGENVSNFAFASEKIGMRFNLWNWKMRSSYGYKESKPRFKCLNGTYENDKRLYKPEPIISNLHALVYGSGLLYQLTDLGTERNINATFLGTGLGLSFYNKLSFNATLLWPIKMDEQFSMKAPMINIGFDVLFVDYINELNKKRKAKKELKDYATIHANEELKEELKNKQIKQSYYAR